MKRTFILSLFGLFFFAASCKAMDVPIDDFPINAYSQETQDYLSPNALDYTKPMLSPSYQESLMQQFYNHYYSTDSKGLSPWSETMIRAVLPAIKKMEPELLENFNNQNKLREEKHYAENFKEKDSTWLNNIKSNMDLETLASREFNANNRAIAINNSFGRGLPDEAPDFFHLSIPGQGFPFDNLQDSAIFAGTPLYVISTTKDKAWALVVTPDAYFTWIKTNNIAAASPSFIKQWQDKAQESLVAISKTKVSIFDSSQRFQFSGYIGAVFPEVSQDSQKTTIYIPFKNDKNQAAIKLGFVPAKASSRMPLSATKQHLAQIINQLKNRPYGWGGAFFFNDCSQELKSLFTPFGIWLPRNSANMSKLTSLDLSKESMDVRLRLLKEKAHPMFTIVYIGGHVMLYLGMKEDIPMTYQNVWGMAPHNRDKRYVIGQSLFIPLLKQYPEHPDAASFADKSTFKLIYLDELNKLRLRPETFGAEFFTQNNDLKHCH